MPAEPSVNGPPPVLRVPETCVRHPGGYGLRLTGLASDQSWVMQLLQGAGCTVADASEPDASRVLCMPPDAPPSAALEAYASLDAHTPPEADLLHPAAVAGWLGLAAHRRFAVTGYTGFGNMLLQAVLREIDATLDLHGTEPAGTTPLRALADHHSAVLRAMLRAGFARIADARRTELLDDTVAPGWLADCTARARFTDGHTLVVGGLPYAGFVGHDFGAHTFWNASVPRFFQHFGYRRVYLVVRDPLAGTASNAAKTARPLERVLHDEAWFRQTAAETARYLADAGEHRDAFRVVRFEDLLHHPRATIQRLAGDAGGELTDAQADAVWGHVGFKPVSRAGAEHLVDPTADKRRHFRPRHLELMREAGLLEQFNAWGYEPQRPQDLPDGPLEPEAFPEKAAPSTLYGRLDPTRLHTRRDATLHVEVRATDAELAEVALEEVRRAPLRRFLRSLGDAYSGGVRCPVPLVS